jgi:hypothetical protein
MRVLLFVLPVLFLLGFGCPDKTKTEGPFTQKDILDNLERNDQERYHLFIEFEHPYFHTASTRLTLYADHTRWAIVFEKSGYSNAGFDGEIEMAYFGNCLINLESQGDPDSASSNMKTVVVMHTADLDSISENELVRPAIRQVRVRDTMVDMEQDKNKYLARNIDDTVFKNPNNLIDLPSLIRYLSEQHPGLFRATDQERRKCLPADLPMLMQIDQWHHEPYAIFDDMTGPNEHHLKKIGTKPRDNETYRLIAKILVSGDTSLWKPTLKPNNDWRNWRRAGYM